MGRKPETGFLPEPASLLRSWVLWKVPYSRCCCFTSGAAELLPAPGPSSTSLAILSLPAAWKRGVLAAQRPVGLESCTAGRDSEPCPGVPPSPQTKGLIRVDVGVLMDQPVSRPLLDGAQAGTPLTDVQLITLAGRLGPDWETVAVANLELEMSDINAIREKKEDVTICKFRMLKKWQEKAQDDATAQNLYSRLEAVVSVEAREVLAGEQGGACGCSALGRGLLELCGHWSIAGGVAWCIGAWPGV